MTKGFSMEWTQDATGQWTAGKDGPGQYDRGTGGPLYVIAQNGWHDTGKTMPKYTLTYRGTRIHESDFLAGDQIADCKRKADQHRGIG